MSQFSKDYDRNLHHCHWHNQQYGYYVVLWHGIVSKMRLLHCNLSHLQCNVDEIVTETCHGNFEDEDTCYSEKQERYIMKCLMSNKDLKLCLCVQRREISFRWVWSWSEVRWVKRRGTSGPALGSRNIAGPLGPCSGSHPQENQSWTL